MSLEISTKKKKSVCTHLYLKLTVGVAVSIATYVEQIIFYLV